MNVDGSGTRLLVLTTDPFCTVQGDQGRPLPLQSPPPSPSPMPPRMLSDWPSLYMKAVSSSVWPRSRKARTDAALAGESMRRPISMVPRTVAGRSGEPEPARSCCDPDMANMREPDGLRLRTQRRAARLTAAEAARSMETAPARWGASQPAHLGGEEPRR